MNSIPTTTKYAGKTLKALEQLANDETSHIENQTQEEATESEVIQSEQEDQIYLLDFFNSRLFDSPASNVIDIEFKKLIQSNCINMMNMKLLSYYGGKLSVAKYENMINTYKLQKERISIGENLNIIIDNVFEGLRAFHLV